MLQVSSNGLELVDESMVRQQQKLKMEKCNNIPAQTGYMMVSTNMLSMLKE